MMSISMFDTDKVYFDSMPAFEIILHILFYIVKGCLVHIRFL